MSNYIVEPDNRLEMAHRTANSEVINVKECDAVRAGIFNPMTRFAPRNHAHFCAINPTGPQPNTATLSRPFTPAHSIPE
jgi:hypothetical protein